MRGVLARLRYVAEDALEDWRRSPGANLLAAGTLGGVLFVGGMLLLAFQNGAARVEAWRSDARVAVYLRDGAAPEAVQDLRRRLEALRGVERVDYVSKDEALRRFRAGFAELAAVPDEIETNPFPASLEAVIAPGPAAGEIAQAVATGLADAPGVEEIRWDREWLDRVDALLAVVRKGGAGAGILVLAALIAVMAGILRLTVYARREEIEIMRLVGASPGLVRGPFLVAGAAQGAIAALAAWALVEAARRSVLAGAVGTARGIVALLLGQPLRLAETGVLLATGLGVGVVAAWLAVRGSERG